MKHENLLAGYDHVPDNSNYSTNSNNNSSPLRSVILGSLSLYSLLMRIFWILLAIAFAKGMILGLAKNNTSFFNIFFWAVGLCMLPVFALLLHNLFSLFQPTAVRLVTNILVTPCAILWVIFVTIPMQGYPPAVKFEYMSEVEKVDFLNKDILEVYNDPASSGVVKAWESHNGRPFLSQIEDNSKYLLERKAILEKEEIQRQKDVKEYYSR